MSTTYAGGITRSILSSTDATPIVITTTAAHGFTTGDTALVVGHLVNTNANGLFAITVVSPTTFSLTSSVGTGAGAGGATGAAYDDSFPTSMTIPSDGDDLDASSVDVSFEALADRTAYLDRRLQPLGLNQVVTYAADYGGGGNQSASTGTFDPFTTAIILPTVTCSTGDSMIVTVTGWCTNSTATPGVLELQASRNGAGYAAMSVTSDVKIFTNDTVDYIRFSLQGVQNVGSNTGNYKFQLMCKGGTTVAVFGVTVIGQHYRPQA